MEGLFVDPHKTARFIWFAFILDTAKAVSPLAMIPFVVVVEFDLPDRFKNANVIKLQGRVNISVSELIVLFLSLNENLVTKLRNVKQPIQEVLFLKSKNQRSVKPALASIESFMLRHT